MVRLRDPYGLALDSIRTELRDGHYAPGAPLIVLDLARALRISPTPVREALARLSGEGLVREQRGRGYHARRMEAADLDELYQLHGLLVILPLQSPPPEQNSDETKLTLLLTPAPTKAESIEPAAFSASVRGRLRATAEDFWATIVRRAGNRTLSRTHRYLSDRLSLARMAEARVFSDLAAELEGLASLVNRKDAGVFTAAAAYHERCRKAAPSLAAAIRDELKV